MNEHIQDYLEYYCNLQTSPSYAVMLDGTWGSGKTWFIKEFQKQYNAKLLLRNGSIGSPFIYASLYGITICDDIDDIIFRQIFPKLSSNTAILGEKVLQSAVRSYGKIDLPVKEIKKTFRKLEYKILIFDDLERCLIPIKELLGYINGFVEHDGLKVIILCNEQEIPSQEESKYKLIKEKIVGQTFKISPDVEAALHSFLEEVEPKEVQCFLEDNIDLISKTFADTEYHNLRHLRQTLLNFGRFFGLLGAKFQNTPDLMKLLLEEFLRFSIEIKAGHIQLSDLDSQKVIAAITASMVSEKNNRTETATPLQTFLHKYHYDNYLAHTPILSFELWKAFFEYGYADPAAITERLNNSRFFIHEQTSVWQKVLYYRNLRDEEFNQSLSELMQQWKNYQFLEPHEILHIAGLFLSFISFGIENSPYKTAEEVVQACKEYIQSVSKTFFTMQDNLGSAIRLDRSAAYGVGYCESGTPAFQEIWDYVDGAIRQASEDLMPEVATQWLETLNNDPEESWRMLCVHSSPLIRIPILTHIDIGKFTAVLENHKFSVCDDVLYGLGKRYEYESAFKELYTECSFIQNFKNKLQEKLERCTPNQNLSKAFIKKWLKELASLESKFENYFQKQTLVVKENSSLKSENS